MSTPAKAAPATEHACSIHRSLDILGEKWSLLIVRNALRGQTKFSEFRDDLKIPSDVLTARLATLVEAGVLERVAYREPGARERHRYELTEEGRALKVVLAALQQWGDAFNPFPGGQVSVIERADTHERAGVAFVDGEGHVLDPEVVRMAPGPAARISW